MQGLNRIFLMGRLGNEPRRYTTITGQQYTGLSIATNRKLHADEDSPMRERTEWHFVRVWGKQADLCAKFLTKGQPVLVEGYLSHYTKQKEGSTESEKKTGINATNVTFLPRDNPSPEGVEDRSP